MLFNPMLIDMVVVSDLRFYHASSFICEQDQLKHPPMELV